MRVGLDWAGGTRGAIRLLTLGATCLMVVACTSAPPPAASPAADASPASQRQPAAPASGSKPAAPGGGTASTVLRFATGSFGQETLDPTLAEPGTSTGYAGPLWDWLTVYTEGQGLKPGLAQTWKQEGLTWTFALRQDVKFHDGTPMTAEDVRFTLMDGFRRPEARSSRAAVFKSAIKDVVVVDKYTVRVETAAPWPSLPEDLSNQPGIEGIVLPKQYIEKVGWQSFADAPVGTGPWKFVRRETGNVIEFEAFKDYWGGAPSFSGLRVLLVPEPATRQAMLQAKEVDVAEISVDKVATLNQAGFKVIENPEPASVAVLLFSTYADNAGALKDIRVRQALNFAIDRNEIIQSLYAGRGRPAPVYPVGPGRIGYPDDLQPYPFDVARARQLLAEAGQSAGFPIKVYTTQGPASARVAESVAGYWSAIGVKASVEPVDIGVLRPKYAANPQAADIVGNGWFIQTTSRLNGASDFPAWWTQSGNLIKMANDMDQMATEASTSATLEELAKKTQDFYRATYQSYRAVPIAYVTDTAWAYGNQVASIEFPRASYRGIQPSIHTAKPAP